MERAPDSAPFAGWFPSCMKGEAMSVVIRNISYPGHAVLVDQTPLWSTVDFKTAKKSRTRFSVGDLARLESSDRRCWSGDVIVVADDITLLYTILKIRVPAARESKILLKSVENVLVVVRPVGSVLGFSTQTEMGHKKETRIRVGVNGFSTFARILIEMGLQSIDVKVVAINEPKMCLDDMVRVWKSTNVLVAKKDDQTLIFEKVYYEQDEQDPSVQGGNQIKINVLVEKMEVTVFRERNQVPWELVNADFVVEYHALLENEKVQISDENESLNSCLRELLKKIFSFGLNVDEAVIRPRFNTDNEWISRRVTSVSIVTRSSAAVKAVCKVLPDWDEQPTSLLVYANACVDRSVDVDSSSVDLKVKLENSEYCSGTNSIASRFCYHEDVEHRMIGMFSWCVDVVRCLPVGGCRLELI